MKTCFTRISIVWDKMTSFIFDIYDPNRLGYKWYVSKTSRLVSDKFSLLKRDHLMPSIWTTKINFITKIKRRYWPTVSHRTSDKHIASGSLLTDQYKVVHCSRVNLEMLVDKPYKNHHKTLYPRQIIHRRFMPPGGSN